MNSAKKVRILEDKDGKPLFTRLELDSHADTRFLEEEPYFTTTLEFGLMWRWSKKTWVY